jgi:hemolysin activation/secretion protein
VGLIRNSTLVVNELYRLGGLATLRGFNENEFYASSFWITQIEGRLFTDQGSFFRVSTDVGYISTRISENVTDFFPISIGAGFALTMDNGQFNFMFANGMELGSPINFSNVKVHFGYTALF